MTSRARRPSACHCWQLLAIEEVAGRVAHAEEQVHGPLPRIGPDEAGERTDAGSRRRSGSAARCLRPARKAGLGRRKAGAVCPGSSAVSWPEHRPPGWRRTTISMKPSPRRRPANRSAARWSLRAGRRAGRPPRSGRSRPPSAAATATARKAKRRMAVGACTSAP